MRRGNFLAHEKEAAEAWAGNASGSGALWFRVWGFSILYGPHGTGIETVMGSQYEGLNSRIGCIL